MRDSAHLGWPAGQQQNSRFGKRLDGEIYVASEPSATPPRNYALLDMGYPYSSRSSVWLGESLALRASATLRVEALI
jgi:hypothetical protein